MIIVLLIDAYGDPKVHPRFMPVIPYYPKEYAITVLSPMFLAATIIGVENDGYVIIALKQFI